MVIVLPFFLAGPLEQRISVPAFSRNTLRLDSQYTSTDKPQPVFEDWEDSREALELQTALSSCGLNTEATQNL